MAKKLYEHATRIKSLPGTGGLLQVQRRQPNGSWIWCVAAYFTDEEAAKKAKADFDAMHAKRRQDKP